MQVDNEVAEVRLDPDDAIYANEEAEKFKCLFIELGSFAASGSASCADEDRHLLEDASHSISVFPNELLDLLNQVDAGLRGDVLDIVGEMVDSAFAIGSISSTTKTALLRAKRNRQKEAGLASGVTRRLAANEWKALVARRTFEIRAANPKCATDDVADILRTELAKMKPKARQPGIGAIADYVRQMERSGEVPKKSKT